MGDNETIGRVRLGTTVDQDAAPQHGWLLLIPLLALGYGFYTQFDRIRAMLAPEPVVEERPAPIPAPAAAPAIATAAPAVIAPAPQVQEPAVEPQRSVPAPLLPERRPPPRAELRELFPVRAAAEPARRPGRAGLAEALRNGEIRLGTAGDIGRWKSSYTRATGRGVGRYFDERMRDMDVYIVQKEFEMPGDLGGANAVVFVLETRSPFPNGDAGHSPILDASSGACVGAICRMLLSDD